MLRIRTLRPILPLISLTPALLLGWASSARGQSAPPPPVPVPVIRGLDVDGSIDPPGRVEAYLQSIIPPGSFWVEAGAADRSGMPIGTVARLRRALERLGYDPTIEEPRGPRTPGAGEIRLRIHLVPLERVRYIFVSGNRRVRQDEILRRISIRPGQALPPAGSRRQEALARERDRVLEFLRSQGYIEAAVDIQVASRGGQPPRAHLTIKIDLGAGFPIGPITVQGNRALTSDDIEESLRHSDWRATIFGAALAGGLGGTVGGVLRGPIGGLLGGAPGAALGGALGWYWTPPLPFTRSLIREDVANLVARYQALGYLGVRILEPQTTIDHDKKVVGVTVVVTERKRIDVAFEGNRHESDGTLKSILTGAFGGAYDDYAVTASADAIAQHYRSRGYMLAAVKWRRSRLSADADRIVFAISEGPQLRVREVTFVGNSTFDSALLSEVVTVKVFPPLGFMGIGEGGYATPLQLELDVERLADLYRSNGHPDASVKCEFAPARDAWQPVRPVTPTDPALPAWRGSNALHVRFLIQEGPLVRVKAITFEATDGGILPRDQTFMRESLLTTVGSAYRPNLVRADVDRLQRLVGDTGYPRASAEPLVTRTGNEVAILWQVKLGKQVHLGPVFLRGNFLSRENTIRQWVPLGPGSLVTTTAFERGQRNLALIQLFNNASPISFPDDAASDGTQPLLIEVEERHDHWGVVRVGGGASTEQVALSSQFPLGVYSSLGYEHRNLFGFGWRLLSKGEYGNSLTRADADLLDPKFFGTMFRLEISGNYLRQATVRLGDIRSGGGTFGFAREMYPGIDARLAYGLRRTYRTEFLVRGAGAIEEQDRTRIGTTIGNLLASVDWLRLDNPLVPTRGFKVHGSVELVTPALSFGSGEDTFIKTHGRSLAVVPLGRWLSLRHSFRYDQGFPLRGASVLPKTERFFSGGDATIRGFELDRARTETIRYALAPGLNAVEFHPLGGSLRILHNIDLIFPISRPIYGSVFMDNGLLADSFDGVRASDFRHSIGVSPLLIRVPIGDISFSWAWPLDPQPGDSPRGRFHFNIGLMF